MRLKEGVRQLAASKKIEKVARKPPKVMIESWTAHGPSRNMMIFDGEMGYDWEVLSTTDLQFE